jgi:ATP-binding cassette subfamily B protein
LESLEEQSLKNKIKLLIVNALWVLKFAWNTSPMILFAVLFSKLIISAIPAGLAWFGRCLLNSISTEATLGTGDFNKVLPWLIASLGLALLSEVFSNISYYFNTRLKEELSLKIDIDSFEHASKLDVSHFEDPEFQDIVSRASQNAAQYVTDFLNKVIMGTSNLLKSIGLISILFIIDPVIIITIAPLVLPYLGFKWSQSKYRFNKEYSRATKRRWTKYFHSLVTNRDKMLEVKLLNLAPFMIKKYKKLKMEFFKENQKIYSREFIGSFVFSSIFAVLFYLLFARISVRVMNGSLTIGDIAIFAGSTRQLFATLTVIAGQLSGIMEGLLYVENLMLFFKAESRLDISSGKKIKTSNGNIVFENVSFTYPGSDKPTLNDISFNINSGETIAVIGKNGAGKSTLVKLIARLYDPDQGRILLDQIDIKELSLKDLQCGISFVFQSPNRYEGSVVENISCGNSAEKYSLSEIKELAQIAGVHQMIEEMPEKYNTNLGRQFGDYDLSGGQWQKIAIARAAARKNSSILILDEPAAGLDVQSKKELIANFQNLAKNKTTILISHRFSTLALAGRIMILDKGHIVDSGTHDELLKHNEFYSLMYHQSKA